MALATPTSLYSGGAADTGAGDPYTPASITTVANRLYLAFVECPNVTVSSLTLPGTITMTEIGSHIRGTLTRVTAFYGVCSVGGSGSPSVDFSGAVTGAVLDVWEISSGFDTSTPIVAANYIESDGTDASSPTDIALTLPNALGNANNMIVLAAVCNANAAWTAGTGYADLTDAGYSTPTRRLAVQYDITPADLVADGSFAAAAQWAALAFEVAESAGALTPAQIVHTRQIFAPTVSPQLRPGRLDHVRAIYTPDADVIVSPALLTHTRAIHAPQVNVRIFPALLTHTRAIHSPTVAAGVTLLPDRLDHTRAIHTPTVSPQLRPGQLVHTRDLYGPTLRPILLPARLDHGRAIHAPNVVLVITPARLDHARAMHAPTVSPQLRPGRLDHVRAIYTPGFPGVPVAADDLSTRHLPLL